MLKACIEAQPLGWSWVGAILRKLKTSIWKSFKGNRIWLSIKKQL